MPRFEVDESTCIPAGYHRDIMQTTQKRLLYMLVSTRRVYVVSTTPTSCMGCMNATRKRPGPPIQTWKLQQSVSTNSDPSIPGLFPNFMNIELILTAMSSIQDFILSHPTRINTLYHEIPNLHQRGLSLDF